MRLWHQSLIPKLPRQQLLGQHRECAALRGKGWGENHSVVNYVFLNPPEWLYVYHTLVMDEMIKRSYKPDILWSSPSYRGKNMACYENYSKESVKIAYDRIENGLNIYNEHSDSYYRECVLNLLNKGIIID